MSTIIGKCNVVDNILMIWCPACNTAHGVDTKRWTFDGNHAHPTLSPSLLSRTGPIIYHSYVRKGCFEYLGDCNHAMAGQTIPIPDWPYQDTEEVLHA